MWHCGAVQTIRAGGQTYRLARFTRALTRQWLEWGITQIPDPFNALADLGRLPDHSKEFVIQELTRVAEVWRSFADPVLCDLWVSENGIRQAFFLMLEQHHTDIDLYNVYNQVREHYAIDRLVLNATGRMPVNEYDIERQYFMELGWIPRPVNTKKDKPKSQIDWVEWDRKLFQECYLTPAEVDQLTIPEIMVMVTGKPTGDYAEGLAVGKCHKRMTPEQKQTLLIRNLHARNL